MIQHPELTPYTPTEPPGPGLFMMVLKVARWSETVAWYVETLGMLPILKDDEHQFALLATGNGRLALQGTAEPLGGSSHEFVRLVFLVDDLDAERERLLAMGLEVTDPVENPREGYREIRLSDPEGTPLTLFAWTATPMARNPRNPPE